MNKIAQNTLKKALMMLNAVKAEYLVIDSDGKQYGTLQLNDSRKRKRGPYPWGQITAHCRSHIKTVKVGESFDVPVGEYTPQQIQKLTVSLICKQFGKSAYTTCISDDRKSIQVLRIV